MNRNNTLIHIDLGSSAIRTVSGFVNEHDELVITGDIHKPSDNIKNGIIVDPHNTAYIIVESIKLLSNKAKLQAPYTIILTVNARSMKSLTHAVERPIQNFVSDTLLRELRENCFKEVENSDDLHIFECTPDSFYIDGETISKPKNSKGSHILAKFNLLVGSKLIMDSIERTFYRTAHPVRLVILGAEALSTVLLEEHEKEDGVAIISFGAGTTTLSVFYENKLQHLSVVPLGGINITKDISSLAIGTNYAEVLKVKMGAASEDFLEKRVNVEFPHVDNPAEQTVKISTPFLAQVIGARLDEIMEPIFEQLDNLDIPLNAGIVVTGGGSKLTGLPEYIEQQTGLPVRMGEHSDWLEERVDEKYLDPEFAQTVGALVLGNHIIESERDKPGGPQIDSPISDGNFFEKFKKKAAKKFNKKMDTLFGYDEVVQ